MNIINIVLVALILVIIYLLVLNYKQNSETVSSESSGTINNYTSQIISIKQLDSLSASSNFHFSYHYAKDPLPGELR
jgi:hypothetical protein